MRKNITFFILQVLVCLFFSEFAVKAQPVSLDWAIGMGGTGVDAGNALALDSAGNVYIAGGFSGTASFDPGSTAGDVTATGTGTDIFIAKYDNAGNFLWVKTMGGKLEDVAADIALDTAGNIYITGSYRDTADFNPGPATAELIATGGADIFFAKYDNNGNYIYAKTLSGTTGAAVEIESGSAIGVDLLGNVYVGGQFRRGTVDFDPGPLQQLFTATGNTDDIFIAKYDNNGDYAWAFKIGGSGIDNLYDMSIDDTGNVYVTGQLSGAAGAAIDLDPGPDPGNVICNGGQDVFIAKYNAGGHFVWAHALGSSLADRGKSITVDAAGYIYITGEFQTGTGGAKLDPAGVAPNLTSKGNFDAFVAKYDNGGNYIWATNIGGKTGDAGNAITVDDAGDVVVTGYFTDTAYFDPGNNSVYLISKGGNDVFVAKYDTDGQYVWASGMGGTTADEGFSVKVDTGGSVFTVGTFNGIADFDPGPDTLELTTKGNADIFLQKLHGKCHTQVVSFTETVCDSFVFNGQTYTQSGTFADTFAAVLSGCDSITLLDLTIIHSSPVTALTEATCDSFRLGDSLYTTTGSYAYVFTNAAGCDSVIALDLIIYHPTQATITLSACDSFVLDGIVYTTSGTYLQTLTNTYGCDSVVTIELEVHTSPQAEIIPSGNVLAAANADAYQWLDCVDAYAVIPGATSQLFTPERSGSYAVAVTALNGCSDTSACVEVVPTRVNDAGIGNTISVYPNPAGETLMIHAGKALSGGIIKMKTVTGKTIKEWYDLQGSVMKFELTGIATGMYLIEIQDGVSVLQYKLIKQ